MFKKWENDKPDPGDKIVIICDDNCSSTVAMMLVGGPVEAEEMFPLDAAHMRNSWWALLPEDYGDLNFQLAD